MLINYREKSIEKKIFFLKIFLSTKKFFRKSRFLTGVKKKLRISNYWATTETFFLKSQLLKKKYPFFTIILNGVS